MKILGIDPGIGRMGWGIIEKEGQKVSAIEFGCLETDPKLVIPQRLCLVFDEVEKLVKKFKPQEFAIEELFFNTNAKTAFVVGQARGVILLAASKANLNPAIYTPLQVKIALTGYGRAEKSQVGLMVKNLLKLSSIPKPDDTADALAIALTHAFSLKASSAIIGE